MRVWEAYGDKTQRKIEDRYDSKNKNIMIELSRFRGFSNRCCIIQLWYQVSSSF
jgi:hypothetical protein